MEQPAATSAGSEGRRPESATPASTWLVALAVLLLSLPAGTLLEGLFGEGRSSNISSGEEGALWDRLFIAHNPLPAVVGENQVTVQMCTS